MEHNDSLDNTKDAGDTGGKSLSFLTKLKYFRKISKPKEKFIVYFFSFLLIISVIGGAVKYYFNVTKKVPTFGGEYIEGLSISSDGIPTNINPILSSTRPVDSLIASVVFSSLFNYDKDGQLIGDLVDKYEITDNGKKYILHLKDNVFWHDGEELTSNDVAFTINLLKDPNYNPISAKEWEDKKIKVSNPDKKTVILELSNAYAPFLNKLVFGILPKHLWKDIDASKFTSVDLNLQPVGSGPFIFDSLKNDKDGNILSYRLIANKNYYGKKPYLEKLIFKFYPDQEALIKGYQQKEITGFGFSDYSKVESFQKDENTNVYKISIPQYFTILLNPTKSVPLANKEVRQALQYATNRDEIISKVFNGYAEKIYSPLVKPFIKNDFNFDENLLKYSPEEARKILDKAGWKLEENNKVRKKDGEELKIKLVTTESKNLLDTVEILQEQWEQVGVKVEIIKTENKLDIRQKYLDPRDYEALILGLEYSGNDPNLFFFWHSTGKKSPGLNFAMYDNSDVDKLLEESKNAKSHDEENLKYIEISKHLIKDVPAIFLYSPKYIYLTNKKIQGVSLEAITKTTNRFNQINTWYIKTKRERK